MLRRLPLLIVVGAALLVGLPAAANVADGDPATEVAKVRVGAEPDGSKVSLDTTLFLPHADAGAGSGGRHPAVLLTHGFGGSKAEVVGQATDLARHGYVVLTYSARGFGGSGGRIHIADPDFEIKDARALVDVLAQRPEVQLDAPGDPRVAAVGGSYGGAISLMTGATDPRIDTVAALITWNDLSHAFFPQSALAGTEPATDSPAHVDSAAAPGPFKQLWASRFFLGTAASGAATDPVCGRFDPTICALFLGAARTGRPGAELLDLLAAHSPRPILADLTAPTYLIQGMADSLFGLEEADATARQLGDAGTPVAVRWIDGGHDAPSTTAVADEDSIRTWLDAYLAAGSATDRSADPPVPAFTFAKPLAIRATTAELSQSPRYLDAATYTEQAVDDTARPVLNPPGGQPSSLTVLPVTNSAADPFTAVLPTYQLAALPGQSAAFDTPALDADRTVVGSPRVRLTVTSTGTESTLFLSLWQVSGDTVTLPRQSVAPVRVATRPGTPTTVEVALPAGTWQVPAGDSLRVLVTSTDQTYAAPRTARADLVSLSGLSLPRVQATPVPGSDGATSLDSESLGVVIAIGVLALLLLGDALVRRWRRRSALFREDLADVPLVINGLVKTFSDGHRAVDDVSWTAGRGEVVGLLGPNGAGKTTTLRMVMGLIWPDSGTVHVLGEPVSAGSQVLARVGALIEGPGFLPHLTGRQNLEAYWAATGRDPQDAGYDEVLAVAALGGAVDRPVRTYSHGMRQRLGIAQAMLGLPEVLVLDEPTNGLDPPQIAGLRPILQRYAAAGRTVVVSSHLLAEVEMTCSHVVVMHAGRVVTTGTVAELVDSSDTTEVTLQSGTDPRPVAAALRRVDGVTAVEITDGAAEVDDADEPKLVVTASLARGDVVRAAAETGAPIVGVSSRRHLEQVFLGVIAAASADGQTDGHPNGTGPGVGEADSLTERLRQVRSR